MSLGSASNFFLGAASAGGSAEGPIKSVRVNSADNAKLTRTPSSAGNRKTWTWAGWVKLNRSSSNFFLGAGTTGSTNYTYARFGVFSNKIQFLTYGQYIFTSDALFRDYSGWGHITLVCDTTESTAADRLKVYWNGVQLTNSASTTLDFDGDYAFNNTLPHTIGSESAFGTWDGYLADLYFIDGQALDPTSFGAFDRNRVWQAKTYSGTYGSNGYHILDFANESTLGHDSSGNENDFTATNFDTNEQNISFNLDVTSTPFTDLGNDETITNTGNVSTETASGNSLNLTTVAGFDGSSKFLTRASSFTVSNNYTIDYYWNADSSQVSNATIVDVGGEAVFRDYGSATSRTIRLRDTSNSTTDYSYSTSANTWYHVRISNSGIWVNGTSINSSPRDIAGTSGILYIGTYNNSSTSYLWNGEIGPVRISDKDLGAPPSGGLVANSDGTLSNVTVVNSDYDTLRDVPSNGTQSDTGAGGEVSGNYCTFNPLKEKTGSYIMGYADGALELSGGGDGVGTIPFTSGKKYFELTIKSASAFAQGYYGIVDIRQGAPRAWATSEIAALRDTGSLYGDSSTGSAPAATQVGDVYGFAVDVENQKLFISVNGTYLNSADPANGTGASFTGRDFSNYAPLASLSSANTQVVVLNAGQRLFNTAAPSGFEALCTTNLPTPTIADGSDYFDVKTWTGTDTNAAVTVSEFEFSPDFIWAKSRSHAYSNNLYDIVRGTGKGLHSDTNGAEVTNNQYGYVSAFNSDGFTASPGSADNDFFNGTGKTYVAWAWDAGSSTVSNTDGSVTSQVRVNQTAGFSIVSWTSSSTSGNYDSIGHGLNALPGLVITKRRTVADSWYSAHGFDLTQFGKLNLTDAFSNAGAAWGNGHTSSVIGMRVGNFVGASETMIAYCFAPVAGYSAFGSYEGNGSSDGPFVYTGFRPALVIYKNADTAYGWQIYDSTRDPHNVSDARLQASGSNAEDTTTGLDMLSNGFKIRTNHARTNNSGDTFIYAVFAENPFRANGGLAR